MLRRLGHMVVGVIFLVDDGVAVVVGVAEIGERIGNVKIRVEVHLPPPLPRGCDRVCHIRSSAAKAK